jgi:hypothetical protein
MSPIPGEPLHSERAELGDLTTKDGRKVKLKMPAGMLPPRMKPGKTEERGDEELPRDDPAPRHNPLHGTGGVF